MALRIKFGNRSIPLPASRIKRIAIGVALVVGGVLGFLPILGFWMLPLGIIVLSMDIPSVRKYRRRVVIWWLRRKKQRSRPMRKISLLAPPERVKMSD